MGHRNGSEVNKQNHTDAVNGKLHSIVIAAATDFFYNAMLEAWLYMTD